MLGRFVLVDQGVHGQGGEHEPCSQISDNLEAISVVSPAKRKEKATARDHTATPYTRLVFDATTMVTPMMQQNM